MAANEPISKVGLCEHGRVRTLCASCRQAILDARATLSGVQRKRTPAQARSLKEEPEARVSCAQCSTRGTARGFVEDVDSKGFLCRTHAAERTFAHVTYATGGRFVEASAPTAPHWKDVLRDSRATSIRAFTRPPAQG